MNHCRIAGEAQSPALGEWLLGFGRELYEKLVAAGLAGPRQSQTLGEFVTAYIAGKGDVEKRTILNFRATQRKLLPFFGEGRELRDIAEGECLDWPRWLVESHATAAVAGHVKRAKQLFRHAARKGLIEINPFTDIATGSQHNEERQVFITQGTIARVLDACPDTEWRWLVALARQLPKGG